MTELHHFVISPQSSTSTTLSSSMLYLVDDQNQQGSIYSFILDNKQKSRSFITDVCFTCVLLNGAAGRAGAHAVRSWNREAVGQSTQQPREHTRGTVAVAQWWITSTSLSKCSVGSGSTAGLPGHSNSPGRTVQSGILGHRDTWHYGGKNRKSALKTVFEILDIWDLSFLMHSTWPTSTR